MIRASIGAPCNPEGPMRSISHCFVRLIVSLLAGVALAAAQTPHANLRGTWDGTCEPPGVVGGDPFSLVIESVDGDAVRGALVFTSGSARFQGNFDAARGVLAVVTAEEDGPSLQAELVLGDGVLAGQGRTAEWEWGFRVTQASVEVLERSHAPRVVDLAAAERPETFSLVGLEGELGFQLDEFVRGFAAKNEVVGVSVACVVGGELSDVRSLGWEDFFAGVPASDETRYRWASISKPLTATAAVRLTARGAFDLDRDVRELVPEFPPQQIDGKPAVMTPRHILCHQSGIVHYTGARRTWRAYGSPHPFEELLNGLDLFRESPLAFAPGTRESYSTHAWTLLGLAMERAAKKRYHEVVRELVLEPSGMKTTEPDRRSRAIPHRAAGYERAEDGRLVETFDDDISWKLPGGGWISTAGDLARFGAALIGTQLLDEGQKGSVWTRQALADGTETAMGLGFELDELGGERLVSHSGGQRKASTFLALLPERRLAVAVMSNTESAPTEILATAVLRLLLAAER